MTVQNVTNVTNENGLVTVSVVTPAGASSNASNSSIPSLESPVISTDINSPGAVQPYVSPCNTVEEFHVKEELIDLDEVREDSDDCLETGVPPVSTKCDCINAHALDRPVLYTK